MCLHATVITGVATLKVLGLLNSRWGKRKAKAGLSKANTERRARICGGRAVLIWLRWFSDRVLGALASAVTAPDAFYELGRGTTIVTFNLHQRSQTQVAAINLVGT